MRWSPVCPVSHWRQSFSGCPWSVLSFVCSFVRLRLDHENPVTDVADRIFKEKTICIYDEIIDHVAISCWNSCINKTWKTSWYFKRLKTNNGPDDASKFVLVLIVVFIYSRIFSLAADVMFIGTFNPITAAGALCWNSPIICWDVNKR